MEDTLGGLYALVFKSRKKVLILVLMEDTLGVLDREISQCQFVLILVLMEDTLGGKKS